MSETPIQTPEEVKPKAKAKKTPSKVVPENPEESPELEHYETRLKVHKIPNDSFLPNVFVYNPSIVEMGHTTLMAYRYAIPGHRLFNTAIGICEVDKHWNVKANSNRKLELIRRQAKATTYDDPRLFVYQGRLYLLYVNGMLMPSGKWASSMFLADFERLNDRTYYSALPNIGKNLNAASVQNGAVECEKNWTPFENKGKLYFVYTINPLVVYEYDIASDKARLVSTTSFDQSFWKYGEFLAGGTPLTKIGNEFVGFFHSYTNDDPDHPTQRTYHVGFWAMSAEAPYRVTRMSLVPYMTARRDPTRDRRSDKAPWLPNCIFPGGFIERGDKVFIAQGWQDSSCEVVETTWDDINKTVIEIKS